MSAQRDIQETAVRITRSNGATEKSRRYIKNNRHPKGGSQKDFFKKFILCSYSVAPLLRVSNAFFIVIISQMFLFTVPLCAQASDDMSALLPPVSCAAGWKIEGKPVFYDKETLSDRINGEAELYFPYGFERMTASRYTSPKKPETGMDVEIYRMGSLLDAFGMYANYRQREGRSVASGADSNLSGSQLFLYQGRYFLHLQITGPDSSHPEALAECAKTVTALLPGNTNTPVELKALEHSEIVKGSERYLPQSILGYDFLNRGIMADATIDGASLQIFLLQGNSTESAATAFERYRSQLTAGNIESGKSGAVFLEGADSLYGPVIVLKKVGCLAGALKFSGKKGVRALLERVCL
jgi:hypothetical protein